MSKRRGLVNAVDEVPRDTNFGDFGGIKIGKNGPTPLWWKRMKHWGREHMYVVNHAAGGDEAYLTAAKRWRVWRRGWLRDRLNSETLRKVTQHHFEVSLEGAPGHQDGRQCVNLSGICNVPSSVQES